MTREAAPSVAEIRRVLESSSVLAKIATDDLDALARRLRWRRFQRGQIVYGRDDRGDALLILVSGELRIVASGLAGREVILNVIKPGELAGEIAFLDECPRTADVVAATNSEALELRRRDLLPLLGSHPEAGLALMRVLCDRLRRTTMFVEELALLDVPSRLAHRLLTLAALSGRRVARGIRIDHGLSQQALADSLGVSRVSVNKQLNEWRRRGRVDHGRGFVVLRAARWIEDRLDSGP